jgi:hypothetical protein
MVIVRLSGGLGNQMFQYAFGRSLTYHLNTSLKLDVSFLIDRTPVETHVFRDFSLDIFDLDAQVANFNGKHSVLSYLRTPSIALWKIKRKILGYNLYIERRDSWFDAEVFNLKGNLYFEGNWQSLKYFNKIENIIRRDFSFKNRLSEDLTQLANEIQQPDSICLHVRRGDYVWQPYANKINGVKGIEYFSSALAVVLTKIKKGRIYVFSDDIDWCIKNLHLDRTVCFVEHEYPNKKSHEYLRLMSLCDHFVISNSTFSWWAAWLSQNSNKIVVAPKKWFEDSTIDTSDLIPENWIRI